MSIYTQDAIDAKKEIAASGQSTFVRRYSSGYDPVTTDQGARTYIESEAAAVSLPASGGKIAAFDNRFKEDLKKGKIRFWLVAGYELGFDLQPGDYLVWDGKLFDVRGTTPLAPDGEVVIYYNVGGSVSAVDIDDPNIQKVEE